MLPQQSTGLLRRKGATRFYMWLVFSHTPLALFWRLAVLPHGVTAHFVRSISPNGDEGAALDSQGGRVPLDSLLGVATSGTLAAKL